jgi:iron-sulfur cluster repair protein YtfE (RIC family)
MSNAQDKTDAISLLTADHRKVRRLFQEFEELEDEEGQDDLKSELVEQICFELSVHALVEEEIFYPAVRGAIDDDELMDEAQAEHAQVKDLISELEEMTPDDGQFDATVMELSEQVEHHVSEEEGAMFAKAAKAGLDLEALGLQIKERKEAMEEDFSNAPGSEAARGGPDAGHKGANP